MEEIHKQYVCNVADMDLQLKLQRIYLEQLKAENQKRKGQKKLVGDQKSCNGTNPDVLESNINNIITQVKAHTEKAEKLQKALHVGCARLQKAQSQLKDSEEKIRLFLDKFKTKAAALDTFKNPYIDLGSIDKAQEVYENFKNVFFQQLNNALPEYLHNEYLSQINSRINKLSEENSKLTNLEEELRKAVDKYEECEGEYYKQKSYHDTLTEKVQIMCEEYQKCCNRLSECKERISQLQLTFTDGQCSTKNYNETLTTISAQLEEMKKENEKLVEKIDRLETEQKIAECYHEKNRSLAKHFNDERSNLLKDFQEFAETIVRDYKAELEKKRYRKIDLTAKVENLRHVKARKIEYETSKKLLDERNRVLNGLKNKLIDLKEATAMKAKHLEEIKSERKRRAEEFEKHLNFLNIIVGKLKKEKGKLETILILQKQKAEENRLKLNKSKEMKISLLDGSIDVQKKLLHSQTSIANEMNIKHSSNEVIECGEKEKKSRNEYWHQAFPTNEHEFIKSELNQVKKTRGKTGVRKEQSEKPSHDLDLGKLQDFGYEKSKSPRPSRRGRKRCKNNKANSVKHPVLFESLLSSFDAEQAITSTPLSSHNSSIQPIKNESSLYKSQRSIFINGKLSKSNKRKPTNFAEVRANKEKYKRNIFDFASESDMD
ncbi:unnamed protein product [Dracunculus medinensis]|uniref:DUF4515 domain-containing protein n=1 Tax=Dracunculus medinensis TaxID=318479 RepID=A0A0N4U7K6_DRAME|nr:unnamed protein product [Dracunculus medinensis]